MTLPTHLTLEIVTPDRSVIQETVDEVQIPGSQGSLGVLPGHTPLLTTLQVGALMYRQGGATHAISIAFGFAEILPDRVTVLAQAAERADEIDIARAQEAESRARDRLSQAERDVDVDVEGARIALSKAQVRLQVAAASSARTPPR